MGRWDVTRPRWDVDKTVEQRYYSGLNLILTRPSRGRKNTEDVSVGFLLSMSGTLIRLDVSLDIRIGNVTGYPRNLRIRLGSVLPRGGYLGCMMICSSG